MFSVDVSHDRIMVADRHNQIVYLYDISGKFLTELTSPEGTVPGYNYGGFGARRSYHDCSDDVDAEGPLCAAHAQSV